MKTWYEVFISGEHGTMTVAICYTVKEARQKKKNYPKNLNTSLHIDKWENIENPKKIKEIE